MVLHHFSTDFFTIHRDFNITNSDANAYCINGHFYYVPHQHDEHFDWVYVVDGELHQVINGVPHTLKAGDLIWIRKGDWHEESGHHMSFFVLVGTHAWLKSIMTFMQTMPAYNALMALPAPPRCNVPVNRRKRLNQLWKRCWDVYLGSMGPSYAIKLVSELFVDYFMPQVEQAMQHRFFPDWIRTAMNYIQNHVGEDISSEQLADVCNKSPEHVARSFQTHLGATPSQYINMTRLNYAARLLTTTDLPILDISLRAGFGSLGHFYRVFKQRFNRSPRTYRLAQQKAENKL